MDILNMDDGMIDFNKIISESEKIEKCYEVDGDIDNAKYSMNIYQLIGAKDTNEGELKVVGLSNGPVPPIKSKSIKIFDDKYECNIYQHLYAKPEIDDVKEYKIASIDILCCDKVLCSISLEFKYNMFRQSGVMNGQYVVYLDKDKYRDILHKLEKYPGNTNVIELLIKFLTHDKVLDIYA